MGCRMEEELSTSMLICFLFVLVCGGVFFVIFFVFFGLGIGLVLIFVGGCVFERNLRLFEIYFGFLFLLYFVFGKRVFSLFFRILIRIFFSGEFRGWERI